MSDSLPIEALPSNTILVQDGFEDIEKTTAGNYIVVMTPMMQLVIVQSTCLEEIQSSE